MVAGLTDKQSLERMMQDSREERRTSNRVRELASKGLHNPEQLTPDETRELCSSVLHLDERRAAR